MDRKICKKVARKLKHCEEILMKHENIKTSIEHTSSLFIGNGGLGCGIHREFLLDLFSQHGLVKDVIMLPGKPYAFVTLSTIEEAEKAMDLFQGRHLRSGQVLYMAYVDTNDVPKHVSFEKSWPQGLTLIEDFVTEEEESSLISAITFDDVNDNTVLKHRKVKHYGFEFIYGSNNVDKNKALDEKIPAKCMPHLEKLVALGYISKVPDQLTVNYYAPGQGIPPHVDTHSAFEDNILSLSLGSQVVMDFYSSEKGSVSVLLPKRSLLIMSGESRYAWKHGITPRKTDIIPNEGDHLTLCQRSDRISFTFRKIRDGECHCSYKELCNSQKQTKSSSKDLVNEEGAKELESKYVQKVYEDIADHFNDTRYKPWPKVQSFLSNISPGSLILDIGCGNGKNLGLSKSCFEIGCDASSKLAQVCALRKSEVLIADCLKLPFRDNCADVIICIAVIHHLSTKARRAKAIEEILRVLCPGGKALLYVWAFEQEGPQGPSNYLKHNKLVKNIEQDFLKGENTSQLPSTEIQLIEAKKSITLPIHKNRTNFVEQDMLVPWKENNTSSQVPNSDKGTKTHHRYYHVFVKVQRY
ncbi:alkylated DNA repair protein alkB homolog 8-like isoform X2 [Uloborus diversus]|uniref:alkylated DNA repair protein alkB homolog 8-like isoform X2 n=1 Tax=Uloborus diversus TaxID=327109 RepID=UPI002409DCF0|nr:alkylated DNA repair protein alkB homolog 8-like isoform X2 [Uloborus diversus]